MADIPIEYLMSALNYDPDTGQFTWKIDFSRAKAGSVAGRIHHQGYREIGIKNRRIGAHRIAWAMTYGEWPPMLIDHKNGIRDDNRICNLRAVDYYGNTRNVALTKRNTSGYRGVGLTKLGWRATITVAGKVMYLGTFQSAQEASQTYLQKRAEHFHEQPIPRELMKPEMFE